MDTTLFKKALQSLNTEQKRAVEAIEGPVMVNAGPGTGKTQILTLRIGHILEKTDTKPEQILALTFTNAGSFTMRERLTQYIGDAGYRVNIFTFHSFCKYIIDNNIDVFTNFEYANVIDDLQKVKIIEQIISKNSFTHLQGSFNEYQKVQNISRALQTIKKEGLSSEQFKKIIPVWKDELYEDENLFYKKKYGKFSVGDIKPGEEKKIIKKIEQANELVTVYDLYQEKLKEQKLYDFSDMILSVLEMLRTNQDFKYELQEQYQYLLVDEHQDTNEGQNELIELLTDAEHLDQRPNIFTVGDEKQSIYRFQGASEKTFTHFNSIYKDIEHISLVQNYRSTANILQGAHSVITNSIESSVEVISNTGDNKPIMIGEFSNYKFELLYIAQDIRAKIDAGSNPDEIAILYRANKHLNDIKQTLAHYQIPFSVHSRDSVFEDIDISNIISLLRVINNPADEELLARSLFINFVGINGYDAIKIINARSEYSKQNKTLLDIILNSEILKEIGVSEIEKIIEYGNKITKTITDIKNQHILEFLKKMIEEFGYMDYMLKSELSRDKIAKLDKLFDEIKKQDAKNAFVVEDFIKLVDSYHAYHIDIENSNPESRQGVQLMTTHGSKGKEFECVYMINTTRSNWEKSRSPQSTPLPIQDYKGDEHDERRLFYVAMTRAKRELCITYAKSDWEGRGQEKSMFLSEIPVETTQAIETESFENDNHLELSLFLGSTKQSRTIYEPEFITELFFKKGLTVTALNNYISCPIKYFYRNLVRIPSGYAAHMLYGNIVHGALEKFMNESKKSEEVVSLQRLIDLFTQGMEFSSLRGSDKKKYLEKGIESLKIWHNQRSLDLIIDIATEQKIKRDFVLGGSQVLKINGILDKIEYLDNESEGRIQIVDYKTGKAYSKKDKTKKQDLKRQLAFYHILLEGYKEDVYQIEKTSLDFVEPNESGVCELVSLNITPEDIEEVKEKINEVAEEIMSGEFIFKGCLKKDCEWCELHKGSS